MPGVRLSHLSSRAASLALLALLLLTASSTACGKRGDPLPPFQHIPSPVPKARVSQRGPVIVIEWEPPTKTTDGSELRLEQVEVLRRIVEPPPPVLEASETPVILDTEGSLGVTEAEGSTTPGTVTAGEPEVAGTTPAATTAPTTPSMGDTAQPEVNPNTPTAPAGGPFEPAAVTSSPSQKTGQEATDSPREGATAGQTEGVAEGDGPLVMTPPPSAIQLSLKPKGFGAEARIIAKLEVDASGSPLSYEDEWKPRWQGKQLEYAVRYVNPKGLKGAHSRPTSIEPAPPLPAPSGLSATAYDGLVRIAWEEPLGLAEWREAADASEEEGVTFELGFNVYRKPADGTYPSTAPVNKKPLVESAFEDRNVKFGSDWCYVVRGVAIPIVPEPAPEALVDGTEGSELPMPSDEQMETAASKIENAPSNVAGGLKGAAGTNLEQAKQLLPPEPPSLIESESADEICLKPIDTFPPAAPSRLVALETPDGIMISWSESDARDLKGFFVYRADKRRGPFELLTKEPIPLPSFTDSDVSPGENYFYAVSAVDSAESPNESERSSPIPAQAFK